MFWSDWVICGWLTFGALATVATVGVTRKPIEPGVAVLSVLITAGLIIMLVLSHG